MKMNKNNIINNFILVQKDEDTGCSISIKKSKETYIASLVLSDGNKVDIIHRNIYKMYNPKLRDIIREKIEFSLELTLMHLSLSITSSINSKSACIDNKKDTLEVAELCLFYLKDYPFSSIDEYIKESRVDAANLVFANSILSDGRILGEKDREYIVDVIRQSPVRFDFPSEYKELLELFEDKVNKSLNEFSKK